jgi:nuclear pore complex protein Nup62
MSVITSEIAHFPSRLLLTQVIDLHHSYKLAGSLNSHLDDLSRSLASMIESVNQLSLPNNAPSNADSVGGDPISQIEAILNAHLGSLQWIDAAVKEVEAKVKEVEGRVNGNAGRNDTPRRGYGLGRR